MLIRILPLNSHVGYVAQNRDNIVSAMAEAHRDKIRFLITPECALSGYPPEDLMLRGSFQTALQDAIDDIVKKSQDYNVSLILGAPYYKDGNIYNAALHIEHGKLHIAALKKHLPDHGVFDDSRIFAKGQQTFLTDIDGVSFGVMVCEDMWYPDPSTDLKKLGADALISLNASPFEKKKYQRRHNIVQKRVSETGLPFLTVFSTGAQDDLVFDGGAFAYDGQGEVSFADDLFSSVPKDISFNMKFEGEISKIACEEEQIYQAMIHGLRDYTAKNGFRKVVLGLSGGVDSVLSSVVAVDALGAENVTVLLLPSEYTSDASFKDAYDTIHALGIAYETIPIKSAVGTILKEFSPIFENMPQDLTEENIQSRLRGLYLMTYSNKFGAMVLTTGNKSEVAVGYATLYGDMCGGYNVLKDIYKTEVYKLCHYRNANLPHGALGSKGIKIPENVIIKAPTAELRPDQKDSDSLPEYDILDDILYRLIEEEQPIEDIIQAGHTRDIVIKIWRLVHRAEYKRRQSAPGPKISKKSFTKERRYPISHSFSD